MSEENKIHTTVNALNKPKDLMGICPTITYFYSWPLTFNIRTNYMGNNCNKVCNVTDAVKGQ